MVGEYDFGEKNGQKATCSWVSEKITAGPHMGRGFSCKKIRALTSKLTERCAGRSWEASGTVPDGLSGPQMAQTKRILCRDKVRTHFGVV